jgi:hypothetical protein
MRDDVEIRLNKIDPVLYGYVGWNWHIKEGKCIPARQARISDFERLVEGGGSRVSLSRYRCSMPESRVDVLEVNGTNLPVVVEIYLGYQ